MKFKSLFFIFILIPSISISQPNFNQSTGKFLDSSLIGKAQLNTNSFSLDELASDELPLNKLFVTANSLQPDVATNSRGVKDAALFRNTAPAVVLILSKNGSGSGSIISKFIFGC